MKKPHEYLEPLTYNPNTLGEEVIEIVRQVQLDTIEATCKRCAEEATTKSFKLSKFSKTPRWKVVKNDGEVDLFSYDFKTDVDRKSILKVADKMKEELNET